jgi:hypothetical protein
MQNVGERTHITRIILSGLRASASEKRDCAPAHPAKEPGHAGTRDERQLRKAAAKIQVENSALCARGGNSRNLHGREKRRSLR